MTGERSSSRRESLRSRSRATRRWTQTAWSQALDLGDIQFLSDWNADAVRGFGVAFEHRGMKDVAERTAFLVERGGTVRGAWRYDTGEVPDFDELLAAAQAL